MTNFTATIEFLSDRAIVSLTNDETGEWSGAGRIETRSCLRADLYEAGYRYASITASAKGGRLNAYREA